MVYFAPYEEKSKIYLEIYERNGKYCISDIKSFPETKTTQQDIDELITDLKCVLEKHKIELKVSINREYNGN